jgi:hypothetical protein
MSAAAVSPPGFTLGQVDRLVIHFRVTLANFAEFPPVQLTAFFIGSSVPKHPAFVSKSYLDTNPSKPDMSILFQRGQTKASHILVNVFAVYKNPDIGSWEGMHFVGFAKLDLHSEFMEAEILSEKGLVLGRITAQKQKGMLPPLDSSEMVQQVLVDARSAASSKIQSLKEKLKQRTVHPSFTQSGTKPPPQLIDIQFRNESWPIVSLLASLHSVTALKQDVEQLFGWWLQLAKSNVGICRDVSIQTCSLSQLREVIAETFTMPMKGLFYSRDILIQGKGKDQFKIDEQWCPLSMFPDLSQACFDCEDGMMMCIEFLVAFQSAAPPFENEELQFLHDFLRPFTPCYAIGQLRVFDRDILVEEPTEKEQEQTKYILHAFPLLMNMSSEDEPAIVLETTNYLSSCYSESSSAADSDAYDKADETVFPSNDSDEQDARWRIVMHFKAPIGSIIEQRVFGLIHSVFYWDTPNDQFVQKHVVSVASPDVIGAPFLDVVRRSKKVQFAYFAAVTKEDLKLLQPFTVQHTPFSLPLMPRDSENVGFPITASDTRTRILIKHVNESIANEIQTKLEILSKDLEFTTCSLFRNCPVDFCDMRK